MSYSILSLDGGGTWALIQVRILQEKYTPTTAGHDILKDYDMVIANSGGSLVLAALCANMTLDKIRKIFEDESILKTIFDKKHGIKSLLGFERFSAEKKIKGLEAVLGKASNVELQDLPAYVKNPNLQIIITGFDYDKERATYFRSNKLSMMEGTNIQDAIDGKPPTNTDFDSITLLHAIHAASNAPVLFFDDPARIKYKNRKEERLFWDGAVGGNNNPITSGVLEALANGVKREDIRVVSIGTANTVYPILYGEKGEAKSQHNWLVKESHIQGDLEEVKKMANAIITDPPDAATFISHHILGLPYSKPGAQLIRINPLVKPILDETKNMWMAPGKNWEAEDMETLFTMDMAVTDKDKVDLINRLCDDFFAGYFDNQGIRTGGKRLDPILGHKKFQDAKLAWESW